MVPVQLISDLSEELNEVLAHFRLPSPIGGETEINIFQFGVPIEKTKEDKKKKFPYILVTPQDGEIQGGTEPQKANVQLLIGVYDEDLNNQGKKHVMNIINDICERFSKDPVLKGRYYADEEIKWVVDEEEEYPYHYGAVWLGFNVPEFRRESEYA